MGDAAHQLKLGLPRLTTRLSSFLYKFLYAGGMSHRYDIPDASQTQRTNTSLRKYATASRRIYRSSLQWTNGNHNLPSVNAEVRKAGRK